MPRCAKRIGKRRCKAKCIKGEKYCLFHSTKTAGLKRRQQKKNNKSTAAERIAKRRAIIYGHQTAGKIATVVGPSMVAFGSSKVTIATMGHIQSNRHGFRQQAEFTHRGIRYTAVNPRTIGPVGKRAGHHMSHKGKRQSTPTRTRRRSKTIAGLGTGVTAYGRTAKQAGYIHAYGPRSIRLRGPGGLWMIGMTAEEAAAEGAQLKIGAERMADSPRKLALGGYTVANAGYNTGKAILKAVF